MKILLASDFTVVIKALLVLGKSVKGENAKLLSYKGNTSEGIAEALILLQKKTYVS